MDETIEQQWEINKNATNQELFDLIQDHHLLKNQVRALIANIKVINKEHQVLAIKIFEYLDNKLNIKETNQDKFLRCKIEDSHQNRLIIQEISKIDSLFKK